MTTEHSSKRCTKCGEEKLLSEFYSDSKRKDGARAKCKACFPRTKSGKRTPEQRAAYRRKRGGVICEYVPKAVILQRAAEKRAQRQAEAELRKQAREASRRAAKGTREWYLTATEQEIADYREHYRLKYQRRYEAHGEQERARATLYRHANPEKVTRWGNKRKQLAAQQSDGSLNSEAVRALFSEATVCPYCTDTLKNDGKTLDHVTPLSLGGAHSIDNVAVCCKACNLSKGAKPLIVWMFQRVPGRQGGIGGHCAPRCFRSYKLLKFG